MKANSKFSIQWELVKLGFRIKQLGLDYYRALEYPLAIQQLKLEPHHVVADIGSLDSTLPLYIARRCAKIYSIDLSESVKAIEISAKKIGLGNLETVIENATGLSFTNNFFDRITAISCIEHFMPLESGDIDAIKEIERVLKPGGIAVITVPFGEKFEEEWRAGLDKTDEYLQRRYDFNSLKDRLITSFGKNLEEYKVFYFSSRLSFENIWYKKRLVFLFYPISFVFTNIFLKTHKTTKGGKGAVIVLRKKKFVQ